MNASLLSGVWSAAPLLSINLEDYDRSAELTPAENLGLQPFLIRRGGAVAKHRSAERSPDLARLMRPIKDVLNTTVDTPILKKQDLWNRRTIKVIYREMHRRQRSFWAWTTEEWAETLCPSTRAFETRYGLNDGFRTTLLKVAYLLCGFIEFSLIGIPKLHKFAARTFGQKPVDDAVRRVYDQIQKWGYRDSSLKDIKCAVSEILLCSGSPRLEDVKLELLIALRARAADQELSSDADTRSTGLRVRIYIISRALASLGILHEPLTDDPNWNKPKPDVSLIKVSPEWASWCERWRNTSTLQPASRKTVYYSVLAAGRWLAKEHPWIISPAQWTRELAAEYVAAVDRAVVGQWTSGVYSYTQINKGKPLRPVTKDRYLSAVRTFFRDCQEWEWIPRVFNPLAALATPNSIRKLIGPDPRVIDEDVWAKLLWAGLSLTGQDLPTQWFSTKEGGDARQRYWYPLEMIRALAIVWLFAGLRRDEIIRLRVGCVRWQREDIHIPGTSEVLPKDSVCMLEVPTNKTSRAFTKPVDLVVGEAVEEWERVRFETPSMLDVKTGEMVQYLFAYRVKKVGKEYINQVLIPMLCHKAGVSEEDARGRITSHRARSTIATQLANAEEPMTLQELKEWLGHTRLASTLHYVRTGVLKLAKAYDDANTFSRDVRNLDLLIGDNSHDIGAPEGGPEGISEILSRSGLINSI